MPAQKPLIVVNGTNQQLPNADTLVVGTGIDTAAAGTLTVGTTTANAITIGKSGVTTTFPGPVALNGTVTSVTQTQFITNAQFDGNVTLGNAATDTVTFTAEVDSNIAFKAPGYKITNLANGTNPGDAVNFSQLSAIVSGVSSVSGSGGTTGLTLSGGPTGAVTLTLGGTLGVANGGTGATTLTSGALVVGQGASAVTTLSPGSNGQVLTVVGGAWAAAAPSAAALTVGSTAIASGAANRVLFEGAGNVLQESANLTWDGSTFTVGGVLSLAEGTAPSATASFGKFYALSSDSRPYFLDDGGQAFNLTLDRFNTLTYGVTPGSVTIDTSPALPIFNSLAISQNTTFTTSNLGNGRSASVRVSNTTGSAYTLTWPAGWTWLGSGAPSSIAANTVGYLSITAYGAADANVVAAWSFSNQPAAVTGSGVDNQIAVWSGTNTQDGSSALTFNGTTLGLTGGITQSGGAVGLTANAASSFTTSAGALTLTSAAAATWSSTAGNLAINGGANLELGAAALSEVVVNQAGANVDFRVEGDNNTKMIFVDASQDKMFVAGEATTNAHTFNIGTSGVVVTDPAFAIGSGGRIHYYDGTPAADGEVLIGNSGLGNFAKATLTAGTGIAITNGAGSISIAASNAGGVQPITTISTGTTLGASNYTVLCSATLTVTLPPAATNIGRVYNIKNIGAAATITIDPNASETIDGATTYTLTTQYQSVTIQCNGTAWFIL